MWLTGLLLAAALGLGVAAFVVVDGGLRYLLLSRRES
jgi:hypothetical protein